MLVFQQKRASDTSKWVYCVPREQIASDVRHGKQRINEVFYFLCDAVVVEGGADVLPGGDEVRSLFEGYFGGETCGARGCRCEFLV